MAKVSTNAFIGNFFTQPNVTVKRQDTRATPGICTNISLTDKLFDSFAYVRTLFKNLALSFRFFAA